MKNKALMYILPRFQCSILEKWKHGEEIRPLLKFLSWWICRISLQPNKHWTYLWKLTLLSPNIRCLRKSSAHYQGNVWCVSHFHMDCSFSPLVFNLISHYQNFWDFNHDKHMERLVSGSFMELSDTVCIIL